MASRNSFKFVMLPPQTDTTIGDLLSAKGVNWAYYSGAWQAVLDHGNAIYPMFAAPSASLTKRLNTKNYGSESMFIQKELLAVWVQAQDNSQNSAGFTGSLSFSVTGIALPEGAPPNGLVPGARGVLNDDEFESPFLPGSLDRPGRKLNTRAPFGGRAEALNEISSCAGRAPA